MTGSIPATKPMLPLPDPAHQPQQVHNGIALQIHPARVQLPLPIATTQQWARVDGSPWMQRYDTHPDTYLRLPGLGDFTINARGTSVEAWPTPALDHNACQQLYLNNVMPMALSRQGKLVLHASAVEVDGSAIVFIGVSGRGKSTMASHFASAGHTLIVDDGLVVEPHEGVLMAMPGERSVRVWPDSEHLLEGAPATSHVGYTSKRLIPAHEGLLFSDGPCPIVAIFVLGHAVSQTTLALRPLPPALAMIELVRYSFLLDAGDPQRHAELMRAAAQLAASCSITQLDYPRDYAQLPCVHQAIMAHVSSAIALSP